MTEINRQIAQIFQHHKENSPNLVKALFQLLAKCDEQSLSNVHTAILYSLQGLHDWQNVIKFSQKWKQIDYKKKYIERMKKRVNQSIQINPNVDDQTQMNRLAQKYWRTKSPKRKQQKYQEPIMLNKLLKNRESQINVNLMKSKSNDDIQIKKLPIKQQNTNKGSQQHQSKIQVTSFTTRPPILKKTSIFDLKNKQKNQIKSQNNQQQSKSHPGSNLSKLLKLKNTKDKQIKPKQIQFTSINSQGNLKSKSNQIQSVSMPVSLPPVIQYNDIFEDSHNPKHKAQNKKELVKKVTLSPIKKIIPEQKIIKLAKKQTSPTIKQNKTPNNQLQFSFMNQSVQYVQKQKQSKRISLVNQNVQIGSKKRLAITPIQSISNSVNIGIKPNINIINQSSQQLTPMFKVQQQSQFLTLQELSIVDKLQPKNTYKKFQKKWGLNPLSVFLQVYSQKK